MITAMKRFCLRILWMVVIMTMPVIVHSQDYDKLWKEVEELKKKDLPRSVIDKADEIYSLALSTKNLPQMMKAFIVRAECKTDISSDSLDSQINQLKDWAETEKDVSARAVLNSIIANVYGNNEIDSVLHYYRISLADKDKLISLSASKYYPVVLSGEVSREYFNDNMYDFLSRRAINGLMDCYGCSDTELIAKEIISIYDSLISIYTEGEYADRSAAALTKEAKLLYLSDHCRSNKYRITDNEAIEELEKLSSDNMDLDVYCDIVLKLADKYRMRDRYVDAIKILDNALKQNPDSRWTKELKRMKNFIMTPSLNVSFDFVYPEYETDMIVSYKNITDLKLETYRLNITPVSDCLLGGMKHEDIVRKYGSRISVNNYSLSSTPDYKVTETHLKYIFPQSGIYMLKLSTKVKEAKPEYRIVHVSPYRLVVISQPDGKKEYVAVDCLTGNPVSGAEIVSYKLINDKYSVFKIYKTDNNGSIMIDTSADKMEYINVRTSGNDFMPVRYLYNRNAYNPLRDKVKVHTSLFTDRSIYRPGQKISLSGVKYKMFGDSVSVEKESRVSLVMRDFNWKEIAIKEVSTDDFGVYSAEFIIPENAFPGYYSVIADNTQTSVKVEEYRRPTFDIAFDELKQTFTFNDSVNASAIAETFSGAPLGMSKVKYRIMRSESWWWRMPSREEEITSGETITDMDGKFHIDFKLTKPDSYSSVTPLSYYKYKVIATVTSPSGETQEGVMTIPVSERSIGLRIEGLPSKVEKEKKNEIKFVAQNLNSLPVSVEVECVVYEIDEYGQKLPETFITCRGKHISNKPFVPKGIYSLPPGNYRIELKAYDDKNRECSYSQDFVLFSIYSTRVPVKTVDWFWQDGTEFTADKPVDIYVGTSENDVYLMVDVFSIDKRISSERVMLSDTIRKFSYSYKPEYGDGISVCFTFMRQGKLYNKVVELRRPCPEKKLDIRWETFRDKLLPGQNEVWKLSVKDKLGNPVEANMLASAYDASLDKLYPHNWRFGLNFTRNIFRGYVGMLPLINELGIYVPFNTQYYDTGINHFYGNEYTHFIPISLSLYPQKLYICSGMVSRNYQAKKIGGKDGVALEVAYAPVADDSGFNIVEPEKDVVESLTAEEETYISEETTEYLTLRENFNETAFYYPMLRTDSMGVATISFVMPDVLTEWKFNGFAHTRNMDYGMISAKFTTSKPFMVQPNVPRFVRVGDKSSISSLLINMSDETISGKITMIIENPLNGEKVFTQTQDFSVGKGENGTVTFNYEVKDYYDILSCTIIADAGEFSDGERHYLPVLSDRQMVVENKSIQLRGDESRSIKVKDLFNAGSKTATDKNVRIEMTANPQWHIISSLPLLSNPDNDNAISWATALYANSLSYHIVKTNPRIKKVFDTWRLYEKNNDDFLSELKRNEELKNIVMSETPWLVEAEDEETRKRQIAFLFDENGINSRLSTSAMQLKKFQLADGSWSWFGGMSGSRFITTRIAAMMARLRSMGVILSSDTEEMYRKSLAYLRSEVDKDYQQMRKDEQKQTPAYMVVKYLYICAIDETAMKNADKKVNEYMINRLTGKSSELNIYEKSIMASVMSMGGKKAEAQTLLQSVIEYMVRSEEMGTYFDTRKAEYSYNCYRIPTHVAAMEAIMRLSDGNDELFDEMRLWLLKQKQVQHWETPMASVDAIYAFLISKGGNVDNNSVVTADMAPLGISTPDDAIGFISHEFTDSELESALDKDKNILFIRRGDGIGWVSVYTSYMEDIDNIRSYQGEGLGITRKYLLDGKEVTSRTKLGKGDRVRVCITISSDRDMDFICIKDSKAACMESVEQLSGYQYSNDLSYYRVNRDTSTEFFIDKLRKGTYTLYYDVYITRTGRYTSGISEIMSVYAPQFMSHSESFEIEVVK